MCLIDGSTKLLLHGDDLIDSSLHGIPLTNQGVVVSSDQSKFGGKSLYFNGSSRLLFPASAITFGSDDFTIDWWEYCTAASGGTRFSSCYMSDKSLFGGLLIGYRQNVIYASTGTNVWDILSGVAMLSATVNQWVHWAVVRQGNTLKTYRNGTVFATAAFNGSLLSYPSDPMAVGDYDTGDPAPFSGYIDEFRITQKAVWTADFIPPDNPYFILGDVPAVTVVPKLLKAGETLNISWEPASGEGVTYTLERQINGGEYEAVYSGSELRFSEAAQGNWKTIRYRVKPSIGETQGSYRESSAARVYTLSNYSGFIIGGGV